jgi:hypothetical protein
MEEMNLSEYSSVTHFRVAVLGFYNLPVFEYNRIDLEVKVDLARIMGLINQYEKDEFILTYKKKVRNVLNMSFVRNLIFMNDAFA